MYILKLLHRLIFAICFLGLFPTMLINAIYWVFFLPISIIRWLFFLKDDDFFLDNVFLPLSIYVKFLRFIDPSPL